MATMGELIEEGMKAVWLIATEGVHFGGTGVRVHKSAGGKDHGSGSHSGLLEPRGTSTVRKAPAVRDITTWSVIP
jgi:hypothetical protein